MKILSKFILLFLLILSFVGCAFTNAFTKNGRSLNKSNSQFKKGSYVSSAVILCNTLKKTPNYKKALTSINEKLPIIEKKYNNKINRFSKADTSYPSNWIELGRAYEDLLTINKAFQNIDSNTRSSINYNPRSLNSLIEDGANAYYNAALNTKDNSREDKKRIAKLYAKVIFLNNNYKDANEKYKQYKNSAMQKVLIKEIKENIFYGVNINDLIHSQVSSNISNNQTAMEYTTLIDRSQLKAQIEELKFQNSGLADNDENIKFGKLIGANILITINIASADYSSPYTTSNKKLRTKKVNNGTKKNPIMIKYEYYEYQYEKKTSCNITASFSILDIATGNIIKKGEFTGEKSHSVNWSKYSNQHFGSDEMEEECLSKTTIIREASKDVSNKLSNAILNYLK